MNKASLHSAGLLDIELFVGKFRLQRFVFSAASIDFDVTAFTWQLLVKTNPGDRINLISLTLGNGLAFPMYEDNVIEARFESVTTSIGEGDYYWQLVRTDTNEPWLNGKAKFSFGPLGSQGTAQEATINLVDQTVSVALSSIVNISGGSVAFADITGSPSDNAALAAALALKLDSLFTQYEKTDNYTLLAADLTAVNAGENVLFKLNSATGKNFTIPANATVAMPVGTVLTFLRTGTGQWTFVEGTVAVNIIATASVLTDAGQNNVMTLTQTAVDEWYLQNGQSGVGTGDVVGPASATNNALAAFDGTTGKLIKNTTLVPTAAGISMINAADAAAQTALLDAVTSGAKGLAPASGGGSTNYLRADGTWAAPPGTGGSGATKVTLGICASALTITNIPVGVQELSATRGHRTKFDATGFANVRLACSITTGAASGGIMFIEYSTDDSTYTMIGSGSGTEVISLVSAATLVTSWIALPAGAQADVWFRCATSGGNAADDPIVRVVNIQFSTT